jgi:hypothetical protein
MTVRAAVALGLAVGLATVGLALPSSTSAGLLPVAVHDSYTAVHGQLETVAAPGVLANDVQLGSGFTAELKNDVNHGTLDLHADGGFTYRSDAGFRGTDRFTYRIDGGLLGLSNSATATIAVTNDAPVASADSYNAVADVEKSVGAPGVLGNDDDADGDDMTVDVVQEPAHGNLNEDDDGSFRYKADDDFTGTDTWRYRVSDGFAWSNTATVTMTVSGPPATPAPTPHPTPTPRPTATPPPSVVPIPTLPPLPTFPPLPSLGPGPTPTPTPRPSPSGSPRPGATPSASPTPTPTPTTAGPIAPGGPLTSPRPDPSGPPRPPAAPAAPAEAPFTLPSIDDGAQLDFDTGAVSFGSFEWAVPALVLTVPGILIVIAVLVQTMIGLAWLPVARRWLGGDRRRRSAPAAVGSR